MVDAAVTDADVEKAVAEAAQKMDGALRWSASKSEHLDEKITRDILRDLLRARDQEWVESVVKLAEFTRFVINGACWDWSLDGGDIQDKAVELGLVVACGKDCDQYAAQGSDQGCECDRPGDGFTFAPALQALWTRETAAARRFTPTKET